MDRGAHPRREALAPAAPLRVGAVWGAVVALLAGLLATVAVQSAAIAAAGPPANSVVVGGTTFSAYVGAGESLTANFTKTVNQGAGSTTTFRITDPSGAVRSTCTVAASDPGGTSCNVTDLTGPEGVWTIEVIALDGQPPNWPESGSSRFDWSISVQTAGGTDIPGRVWTEKYRGYDGPDQVDGYPVGFWVVTEFGSQYEVDLNGFRGGGWAFDSTAFGLTESGTCTPLYQSVEMATNTPEYPPAPDSCGDPYKLFFEPPAADLPATATTPTGTDWVNPPVVTPEITNLQYATASGETRAGTFSYDLVDFTGGYEFQIDTNGDGDYDDPEDRIVPLGGSSGSHSLSWDGLDGLGNPIDTCQAINARVQIDRIDEIHFVLGDAEQVTGMTINQLVGNAPGQSTMYWDDRGITGTPPTPIIDGRAGVESDVPGGVHGWPSTGDSWGNQASIDNWTFSPVDISEAIALDSICDFGDAPDSYGTTLANDGPRHGFVDGLTLGAGRDGEGDGQPSGDATGDGGDEDGVTGPVFVAVGADSTIEVTATNDTDQPATLTGWVDLDNSGTFEPGELVSVTVPANSGTAVYPLTFPGATVTGDSFARFRLYSGTPADIVPTGGWASGEVEDYLVHLYSTEIVKETVGDPVANADGTHTVQFRLTVTREGTGPVYDLDDDFAVGDGVTLNSVSSTNTAPGGIATLDQWDAASSTLSIVEDQAIGDGVSHEYLVTVNATVDGEVLTFEASDCTLGQTESGTGFFNTATVTTGGSELTDEECPEVTDPLIEKTVTSGPTPVGGGEYEVVYQIDVTNKHAAATEYDLDDVLQYGEAITVVGQPQASAITGGLSALENQWNAGSTTLRIQTDEPIPAAAGPDAPTVHSYEVTVRVTVDTDEVTFENSDCDLTGGESGTGLMNTAVITVDEQKDRARECPPPPPAIEHDKRVSAGPKPLGGGRYEIEYRVTVRNKSAGPGVYTLNDRLRYGDSVRVLSAQLTAPASVTANPDWDGQVNVGVVASQPIDGAAASGPARHVYTITVRYRVDGSEWTRRDGDCRRAGRESGTGLLNTAQVRVNGVRSVDDACKEVLAPDLTIDKSLVSGTTAAGDVVRFRLKVSNNGPGLAQAAIRVRDALPRGLELKSASGKGWACQANQRTDVVVCVRDRNLAANKSAQAIMVVTKATEAAGSQTVNTAYVRGPGDDNPDNNSDTAHPPPPPPSTGFRHLFFGAN